MAKVFAVLVLFALMALTLAQVNQGRGPVKKAQLSEGKDLKTASSFGGYGLGFGYGGFGGYGGGYGGFGGWGLPIYGLGWGGLGGLGGFGGYGGYGGGFYG